MRLQYKLTYSLLALLFIAGVAKAQTGAFYNVKNYGAKGDGRAIETQAINKTIETVAAAGGGTVYFPAGNYQSGSIHLKSNISLYIDQGATLIAAEATKEAGYDDPEKIVTNEYEDFGHRHWHNSLIWGENLHDISIMGPGTIWGKGLERTNHIDKMKGEEDMNPNKSIALYKCRNVIIRDISILHGGWFAILATAADNMTIDNVKMDTNRDGMDIDCCQNVRISNCSVNSPYDDGICLKSSYGLNTGRSCENITITNCQVSGFDEGSFLDGTYKRTVKYNGGPTGRIKFGTESNGGYKNVAISNCVFVYCRGLALESVDGALMEDVSINNITMRDIVNAPIFVRLGARMRGPVGTPIGTASRISISNVTAYNVDAMQGAIIAGLPGNEINDLTLDNIRIYFKGGGTKEQASIVVPDQTKLYPEPKTFGITPAYGFYISHVKDLKMRNVETSFMAEDMRPPYFLEFVDGADFQHIRSQKATGTATFMLNQVKNFNIFNTGQVPNTNLTSVDKKEL